MSDVICPKCKAENYICHDDGYGCEEGATYEQECSSCRCEFEYTVSISYDYRIFCNREDEHDLEKVYESYDGLYRCTKCEHSQWGLKNEQ